MLHCEATDVHTTQNVFVARFQSSGREKTGCFSRLYLCFVIIFSSKIPF